MLQHSSEEKEGNSPKKPVRLSKRQQNEIIKLYRANAGTSREIAYTYNVHISTVYKLLRRNGVGLHHPLRSEGATAGLYARYEKLKQEAIERDRQSNLSAPPVTSRQPKVKKQIKKPSLFRRFLNWFNFK
jgi:transposase